jgi:hypothetical protein
MLQTETDIQLRLGQNTRLQILPGSRPTISRNLLWTLRKYRKSYQRPSAANRASVTAGMKTAFLRGLRLPAAAPTTTKKLSALCTIASLTVPASGKIVRIARPSFQKRGIMLAKAQTLLTLSLTFGRTHLFWTRLRGVCIAREPSMQIVKCISRQKTAGSNA